MMKAKRILAASTLVLSLAWSGPVRAADQVIERREVVESTQRPMDEPVVIERHTTIEKEGRDVDLDVGHGGVVSSTIDLTGEVLALPFKLVAGVFDLAF